MATGHRQLIWVDLEKSEKSILCITRSTSKTQHIAALP